MFELIKSWMNSFWCLVFDGIESKLNTKHKTPKHTRSWANKLKITYYCRKDAN